MFNEWIGWTLQIILYFVSIITSRVKLDFRIVRLAVRVRSLLMTTPQDVQVTAGRLKLHKLRAIKE